MLRLGEKRVADMVAIGLGRNIVVYDEEQRHRRQFSFRLIALMKMVARRRFLTRLTDLFLPEDGLGCDDVRRAALRLTINDTWREATICGVKVAEIEDDATAEFLDHDWVFPFGYSRLVIGVCQDGSVLLGAF